MHSRISPSAGSNLPDVKFSAGSMSRGYFIGRVIPLFENEAQSLIEADRMIDTLQTRLHCASLALDKAIAMQQVALQTERFRLEKKNLVEIDHCEVFRSSLTAFIGSLGWLIDSLNGSTIFDFFPPCPEDFRGRMAIGKKIGVLQGFSAANEQAEILCEPVKILIIEIAEAIALQQFELRRKAMDVVNQSRSLANRISRLKAEFLRAVFTSIGIFKRASLDLIANEGITLLKNDLEECWNMQVGILYHAVEVIDNIMREGGIQTLLKDLLKQKSLIQGDAFFETTQSLQMNSELGLKMLILGRFKMLSEGLNFLKDHSRMKLETCTFSDELLSRIEETYENFRIPVKQDRDECLSLMTKHTQEKGNEYSRVADIILNVHTRVLDAKIKSIKDRLIVCQFEHSIFDDLVLNAMQQYCRTPTSLGMKELKLLRSSGRSSSQAQPPLDWRSSWYLQPVEKLTEKYQVTLSQIIESPIVFIKLHERMLESIKKVSKQHSENLTEYLEKTFNILSDSELDKEKHDNLMRLVKNSRESTHKAHSKTQKALASLAGLNKIDPDFARASCGNSSDVIQHIWNFLKEIIETDASTSMQTLSRSAIGAIRSLGAGIYGNDEPSSSTSSTSNSESSGR